MNKGLMIFLVLLLVELLVCGFFYFKAANKPTPPIPNLSILDEITQTELKAEIEATKTPADWHRLAAVYMANGFYAEAKSTYARTAELLPESADVAYDYAFCLSRVGDMEESNKQFARAIELGHSAPAQGMFFIGRNHLRNGDPEQAKAAFKRGIVLPLCKFELAKILYRQGELDESEELLKEVVQAEKGTLQPFVLRSQIALKRGDRIGAIGQSIESEGKWVRIRSPFGEERKKLLEDYSAVGYERLYREASVAVNGRKHLEGRRLLKMLQEKDWRVATQDIWIQLASFTGRVSESVKLMEERLERFEPSSKTLNQIGEIHMRNSESEKALAAWIRGGELNSDRSAKDCYKNLAAYYRDKLDDLETSQKYQAKGLILYAYETLGYDEFEKTLPMTTMATRFDPTSAEAQFLYGRVLLGKAKTPEAIAAFKKCLELDPTFGRAKMYLEGMGELKEDN